MEITKVLIADDNLVTTKIIKQALLDGKYDGYGFQPDFIYTAKNGLEAFDIIGKNKDISFLISEINMPHLNGDDLIEVLIDTGLDTKMKVVFVTSDDSYIIKENIKQNSIGIITKPFNQKTFSQKFSNLLNPKIEEKQTNTEYIKRNNKLKGLLKYALASLFKQQQIEIKIDDKTLDEILVNYFDDSFLTTNEDAEFIFYSVVSEIVSMFDIDISISQNTQKVAIQNAILGDIKHDIKELYLKQSFDAAILNTTKMIQAQQKPKTTMVFEALTSSIETKIRLLVTKVSSFSHKKPRFNSHEIDDLIEFFKNIDASIDDFELCELKMHLEEIENFSILLHDVCANQQLATLIPQISKSTRFVKSVTEQYQKYINTINQISSLYKSELESRVLFKILNSKEIVSHLKANIPKTLPTLQNISNYKNGTINKNEEQINIAFISNELNLLQAMQSSLERDFKEWKVSCFTRVSLFEGWMKTNQLDKLIVDFRFLNNVFDNGLSFIKYYDKKFKASKNSKQLFKNHNLYLMINPQDISANRELINQLNIHIIETPIKHQNIKNILMYS